MAVLHSERIKERMKMEGDYDKRLVITPLLSRDQIGPASVDVRLGCSILVLNKTYVDSHDVTIADRILQVEKGLYERVVLKYRGKFVLHPQQLILGSTLEYVSLPPDIFAVIASRSSWGRLGLVVATASIVQPTFKGTLTLELCNLSESPITLYPGLLVGQLVLHEVTGELAPARYTGRYDCPTEAQPPHFFGTPYDDEMPFWGRQKPPIR